MGGLVEGETGEIQILLCLLLLSRKINLYEQQVE
jgi:hypothetical protein